MDSLATDDDVRAAALQLIRKVSGYREPAQTTRQAFDRAVDGGPTAYSDLTMLPDGTAGILWERGVSDGYQFVTFTRITREREFLESAR